MDPPSSERRLKGRVVSGRYLVEHLIGAGAMGRVYRALHVELGTPCAIKVIREISAWPAPPSGARVRGDGAQGAAVSDEAIARFRLEARAASRLDHPNVLRVIDFGRDPADGLWYLATEHLEGEDLIDVLNAERVLSTERIVSIMRQVCSALQHAHDAGVIHRDIKPENVRLVPRLGDDGEPVEHVKILDFGTAKILSDDTPEEEISSEDIDRLVIGTPAYMSPEQASGLGADARSDIYACGVLLFEMATGRLPFERPTPIALAAAHVECPPPRPRIYRPDIEPALEQLILACLRKNPDERPQSARALREALERLVAPAPRAEARRDPAPAQAPAARPAHATLPSSSWAQPPSRPSCETLPSYGRLALDAPPPACADAEPRAWSRPPVEVLRAPALGAARDAAWLDLAPRSRSGDRRTGRGRRARPRRRLHRAAPAMIAAGAAALGGSLWVVLGGGPPATVQAHEAEMAQVAAPPPALAAAAGALDPTPRALREPEGGRRAAAAPPAAGAAPAPPADRAAPARKPVRPRDAAEDAIASAPVAGAEEDESPYAEDDAAGDAPVPTQPAAGAAAPAELP